MFTIYFTNFGYASERTFSSLDYAVTFGKTRGFDFTVLRDGKAVAAWTIFGGLRHF